MSEKSYTEENRDRYLLIKSTTFKGESTDLLVKGNRIARIAPEIDAPGAQVIDGRGKAVIPGLVNAHTHAAMTLFRGIGDDMPLMTWLQEKIWPLEAKLTREDVYWGTKLALVEMIRSGTTTFFDMYYQLDATIAAVEEMGLRAVLSEACFDHFRPELTQKSKRHIMERFRSPATCPSRIRLCLGPHAIYTVSDDLLKWAHTFAQENNLLIQMHLSETKNEVEQCVSRYGTTPVRFLHKLGVLSPRWVFAHVLYVDDEEIALLAESGAKVVHNPASNMKLGSGFRFQYEEMRQVGITVGLGTDGCSSSNNLDMIEVMKQAALLGKAWRMNPEVTSCEAMFHAATEAGAAIAGVDAGRIAEGAIADFCLIDLSLPVFTPNFNFISNLVYAANGSCVDTVVCDGRILMYNRVIPGEAEIREQAARRAYGLLS
ncbi:MAG: amidohydrolase [Tannerella sp.]|jgi:5-methylthioadenosine/S-adenosylhomocysteine deaminase|nr:amidohydrolase [Tannerella sp.]